MSTLQISKMLKSDHQTVNKAADKIRKRNKSKGFEDISDRDVRRKIKGNYGK